METYQYFCYNCMSSFSEDKDRCPHCGSFKRDCCNLPNQLPCGTILDGKYLIGRTLGQGGFGITYIGLDLDLHTKVAIKEFFPSGCATRDMSDGITVQPLTGNKATIFSKSKLRFLSEARVLAQFSDEPGIVKVISYFEENETSYFVMDYIEGKSLKEVLREEGTLSIDEVLELLQPIAYALGKVHDAKLLHRDIAPDNIIVSPDGSTAVLIDFGAARTASAKRTHSLSVIVKAGYAPPEQYLTKSDQGPWTDIYALCATIYKSITGKTPPPALDRQGANAKLVPPSELGARLTATQEKAIMRGLSLEPEKRQQRVAVLEQELWGGKKPLQHLVKWISLCAALLVLAVGTIFFLIPFARSQSTVESEEALHTPMPTETATGFETPVAESDSSEPTTGTDSTLVPDSIAGSYVSSKPEDFQYSDYSGSVHINGYTGVETTVVIPKEIDGHPVTKVDYWSSYDSPIVSITFPNTVSKIGMNFSGMRALQEIIIEQGNPTFMSEDGILYSNDGKALLQYPGGRTETSFSVPTHVAKIGDSAFASNQNLNTIIINDGVSEIGENSFSGCRNLANIEIPNSIVSIGKSAFSQCDALTNVIIPEGVISIGEDAFQSCGSLQTVSIPSSVTRIGDEAFACRNLTSIQVDNGNTSYFDVEGILFTKDMKKIMCYPPQISSPSYTVPAGTENIADGAFRYCDMLISVTISDGVTSIGTDAFSYCEAISSVSFPASLQQIGDRAFDGCRSLGEVTLPKSLIKIGDDTFSSCTMLSKYSVDPGNEAYKTVDGVLFSKDGKTLILYPPMLPKAQYAVPDGVISIAEDAFHGCDLLTSVKLPNSVIRIENWAFAYCESLVTIYIPKSVISIDKYAFDSHTKAFTIVTPSGSFAETYAKANDIICTNK